MPGPDDYSPEELAYWENRVDDMAEGARRERLRIRGELLAWVDRSRRYHPDLGTATGDIVESAAMLVARLFP